MHANVLSFEVTVTNCLNFINAGNYQVVAKAGFTA